MNGRRQGPIHRRGNQNGVTNSWSEWGLLLAASGLVISLGGTHPLAWSSVGLAVLALFVTSLWRGLLEQEGIVVAGLWPALFLVYCGLCVFRSSVPARSVFFVSQWSIYVAAAAVGFFCLRRGGGETLRVGLIALGAAESLFGLYQFLTGCKWIFWYEKIKYLEDATGTYINHNHFAGFLIMVLPLTLVTGVSGQRSNGIMYLGAAGLMILALLFSRSRMGLVAGLVPLALLGVYFFTKMRRRFAAAALLAVPLVVLLYGAWIGLKPVGERFQFLAQPGYLTAEGRLTIWKDTWQLVRQRPLLGWGPGTFPSLYPTVRTEPSDLRWMEAHNDYLQLLAELGVIGLLLFLVPMAALWRSLARQAWREDGLTGAMEAAIAASMAGLLVHSLTDFHLYVPANAMLLMILAGMGAAGLRSGRAICPLQASDRPPVSRQPGGAQFP